MVLGSSLLEATAFQSPGRTDKKEDVPAPYLLWCKVCLSEILHSCIWGCRHKFVAAGSATGPWHLAEGHKCKFIIEEQGLLPPPDPYVSAVCTLTQAEGCARCGLQSGTAAPSSSSKARGAGSQCASFLLSFLVAPGCHSTPDPSDPYLDMMRSHHLMQRKAVSCPISIGPLQWCSDSKGQ